MVARQLLDPISPHREVPVIFEMCQPVGGADKRRTLADLGPGETYAARCAAVVDLLLLSGGWACHAGRAGTCFMSRGDDRICFNGPDNVLERLQPHRAKIDCNSAFNLFLGL